MNIERYLLSLLKRIVTITATFYGLALLIGGPLLVLLLVLVAVGTAAFDPAVQTVGGTAGSANKLLAIPVKGDILGTSDDQTFTSGAATAYGYAIKERLMEAATDDSIKGVVLEIDSPGGTIYGSRAIVDGVAYYRETARKPVVAFVAGEASSGAYWAAASTDAIFADHGTDVGGIGVIIGPFKYYNKVLGESTPDGGQVITENGIEQYHIIAGTSKDLGDPYRRLRPEETAALQRSVNNDYDQFVGYVAERRKLTDAVVRGQIGALLYDPKSAKERSLIDEELNRDDAYARLAQRANLDDGDFEVIRDLASPPGEGAEATVRGVLCGGQHRLAYAARLPQACGATQ